MNTVSNRQMICNTLLEHAATDRDIFVTCSDSRGSGSMTAFANAFPEQFVELGIAEQNLVSVSAGLATCGKKVFAVSPACFLSTRSYEQAKVDVAYAGTSVVLVGISGGVSYGALGMTHHSLQDIAAMTALPGMRVYLPSDRFVTRAVIEELLTDPNPSYVRVSRSVSEDLYDEDAQIGGGAVELLRGDDVLFIGCGEMTSRVKRAAELLRQDGISAGVMDVYRIKPLNEAMILQAANRARLVVVAEEHSHYGGLGSMIAMLLAKQAPKKMICFALPDEHLIAGTQSEVFTAYGMTGEGIASAVKDSL